MSSLPAITKRLPREQHELKRIVSERFDDLNTKQREFVEHAVRLGDFTEAARLAGYAEANVSSQVQKLRGNPKIAAAIRAGVALRESDADLQAADVVSGLEAMLQTRLDELFVLNANGVPIDVRDWETLSTWQQRAIKKLTCKGRRSARGSRAHIVQLEAELYSPLDILDRISRLRGWTGEGQLFQFNVGVSGDAEITSVAQPGQLDPLLAEIADLVLTDEELIQFLSGADDSEQRQLMRDGIERLRSKVAA